MWREPWVWARAEMGLAVFYAGYQTKPSAHCQNHG